MKVYHKSFTFLLCLFQGYFSQGQDTFHNFGNVQVHNNGTIGFYSNLVNDGAFSESKGLVGFYNENQSLISGAFSPFFYDLEIAVENHLFIDIPITVCNSLNFIYGDIKTTRNDKNVYVRLVKKSSYEGAVDLSKIDGHVAIEGQREFTFPIGNQAKLRPLGIRFIDGTFFAKCEYYYENPSNPESLYKSFDTSKKPISIGEINSKEFWSLTTSGIIQITLTWDAESDLSSKIDKLENVIVVGWSKNNEQWENLGNTTIEGSPEKGKVSSNTFNANDYNIFTVGTLFELSDNMPGNYVITPNSDGANDNLIIKTTRQSPKNRIMIYDKTGKLVYEMSNYQDEFTGNANRESVTKILPEGTYFYLLELHDLNMRHQGYFYIKR
ncbi:gliding motility-associated C-terminal domain-containing protein [Maribacter halichondriae]|uniref:gliding motility-associated C-terminal domain-containing protein n=1 Tax=Maribacter halichondriae TaxID=2980554 RepID=UPI0023590790|nr:gliding motility-associated C-terminal domain-containing protein [Maribacter sp. Hal144]